MSGPWDNYAAPIASAPPWSRYAQGASAQRSALSNALYAAQASGDKDQAAQIMGQIQRAGLSLAPMNQAQLATADQRGAQQTAQSMPWYQALAAGAGKGAEDTIRGAAQLFGANPASVGMGFEPQADAALMNTRSGKIGDYASQAAQMALPVSDISKGLSVAGKAAPYLEAALRAGVFSGLQPAATRTGHALNAGVGALTGAVGQALSPLLGAASSRAAPVFSAAKADAISLARHYGIPLNLSQVTDSLPLKVVGSATKYLPFSGAAKSRELQQQAFNRAVSHQIGEDTPEFTDQILANAGNKIGQGYDDLFGRNTVTLNRGDAQKIVNIVNDAHDLGGADVGNVVRGHVDRIYGQVGQNGEMPGRLFQSIRTDQLNPAIQNANPAQAYYLTQLRGVLQDAAARDMGPEDAAQLAKLNGQYNSLQIVKNAINKRAGGAAGDVVPSRLWNLVNGKYGSTSNMRDLAKLGQTIMKDPINDSGTAQRWLTYSPIAHAGELAAGTGAAFLVPHLAAPLGAAALTGATLGRFMNSDIASRVMPGVASRMLGAGAQAARVAPYLLPLVPLHAGAAAIPQQ